jgi:hypothetical protein
MKTIGKFLHPKAGMADLCDLILAEFLVLLYD